MKTIAQIFTENLAEMKVLKKDKIIIGVSGGADSVCLLSLFLEAGFNNLTPVHINYHFRGEESDQEEQFCRELFKQEWLSGEVFHFTGVEKWNSNINQENAARQFRYQKFAEVQKKHGAKFVSVAHHKNDQAETILMKILRGTSLHGLSAMRFRETLRIKGIEEQDILIKEMLRPLLNISRSEIEKYILEKKIKHCHDSSNDDIQFTRNFIRHQVLPSLEQVNDKALDNLVNLAKEVEWSKKMLTKEIEKYLQKYNQEDCLLIKDWQQIDNDFLKQELLYCFYQELYGHRLDFYKKHLEQLLQVIETGKSGLKKEFGNDYWLKIIKKEGKRAIFFDKK